jgi:uncharacterized protein YihD (DUF1040 family)
MLELIDAFTNDLIRDPVLATDGHVYDRSSLLKYFAARKSEGLPIVSPQDPKQPMREKLGEAPADVVAALAQLRADGELLKARQARSVTFKSLEALKVVFDVLDPLSELLAATLEGWKTPVVIVFGQETSGKSSLLERLAMMPLLPRGEDTCTRLPILLKLRHTKEAQLPVLVVRDSATGKEEVRRTVSLAGGQVDVRHEMERVLAAEQGGLTSVSMTRTIEVHVHSPAVPSIDLVDLPGLKLSAGSDAADMPEKAKALVKAQVEQHKGSAIFLVSCTASTPPSQSLGLQLVEELGLQRDTIGVVTMCDNIGKLDMRKLPDRLRQTSGDAFQLAPHGFIGTMTEPIKDEGLSNVQRLEKMATAERKWFASQPLLSPLLSDGLLTCDALVDKLSSVYARYLRSTWAPQTLIRLNGELRRLQAKSDALGLPEAVEAPTGPALDELRAAACRAAEAVLDEAMGGMADECFDSIIKPTVSKLVKPGGGTGLAAMHLAMVKSAMESHHRFVSQAKQAFAADASTFKLQRFPAFTEAIVAKLQTQASHERGTFVWREQSTAELVHEAANEVTDWREACAAERVVIRKQMLQVEPVKAKTLEVLGIASESVLTTEEVERAVAKKDPAALVALLQACAIGARTPVASGIASLADAPPDRSADPMRGALAAAGALPPLVAMLGDGTAGERAAAAEALGKLAHNNANKAAMAAAGAVEALVVLVRDGNREGKARAAAALGNLAEGDDAIKVAIAEPLVALELEAVEAHLIASLGEVEPAKESEKAWKPSMKSKEELDALEKLLRTAKALLNKFAPEKFEKLSKDFLELEITCLTDMIAVIDLVFDKALYEPMFGEMCSHLCVRCAERFPEFKDEQNPNAKPQTFKRLLLNKCQEEFEKENSIDYSGIPDAEHESTRKKAKARMLGNIRFIGELFKTKIVTERIMHECIIKLLQSASHENPDLDELECLVKLLKEVGKIIDVPKAKPHMDEYFMRIKEMTQNLNLPNRMRYMLQEINELRRGHWNKRVEDPSLKVKSTP